MPLFYPAAFSPRFVCHNKKTCVKKTAPASTTLALSFLFPDTSAVVDFERSHGRRRSVVSREEEERLLEGISIVVMTA